MERNTTERFFIVKENTPFFRQFVAYEEFVDKSCKVFSAFAEQMGMDKSTKFYPDPDQLGIIPMGKDKETFEPHFTKAVKDGGLRLFRRRPACNLSGGLLLAGIWICISGDHSGCLSTMGSCICPSKHLLNLGQKSMMI